MSNLDRRERLCNCGSGKVRCSLEDARGIFCVYVCDDCEDEIKRKYRPEIFDNPRYEHDEPIEEE
jgi:hypothetical protein